MFGRLFDRIAVGRRLLSSSESTEGDPRLLTTLLDQQRRARTAFGWAVGSLLLATATVGWWVSEGTPASEAVAATALAFAGFFVGRWLTERNDRATQEERIITLGSIFSQSPQVIRDLIQPARVTAFLQNLLKTVLLDDELGTSVWQQGVSPIIGAVKAGHYRKEMRYEIRLAELSEVLAPTSGVEVSPDAYRFIYTDLSYRRRSETIPDILHVGLMFEPGSGSEWFAEAKFVLREYAQLDQAALAAVARLRAPDALARSEPPPWLRRVRELGSGQRQLVKIANRLCEPKLEIADRQLTPSGVALDRRDGRVCGLAVQFVVDKRARKRLTASDEVRVRAQLKVPTPLHVNSFPVVFSELTRGAEILLDYPPNRVGRVQTEMFFAGHEPFRTNRVRSGRGRLVIASDPREWIMSGSGVVFSWTPHDP